MSADAVPPGAVEPHWSQHGRDQWHTPRRNDCHGRDRERGWRESQRVDYPSADEGYWGRYHEEGDCVLIVTRDLVDGQLRPVVVTVINLTDRDPWEQYYVRCQVRYGSEGSGDD